MGKHEIVKVDIFRWSPPRSDLTAPYVDGIILALLHFNLVMLCSQYIHLFIG